MHAKFSGRQPVLAPEARGSDRSPTTGPARRRPALGGLLALVLAAGACSTGSEAGTADASPTFARADGAALAFEEPVASVSDLVAPAGEDQPWTVVGSVFDPRSQVALATVWTSDDARRWESTTVEPHSGGTGESMAAAVPTEDGLLAVGQVGDGDEADAALWRQDGDDWRQARPDVMGGDHEQWAFEAAVGEAGTLVAGGENAWGDVRPRLWFSADGESWSSVDGGPGGVFDATGEESVNDIVAVGSGFVAVGTRTLDNEQDGVAWFSPDGETWEQVEAPSLGGTGRQELLTVAVVDGVVVAGGFSAHGADRQGKPFVWRSPDGITWRDASDMLPMGTDSRHAASDLAVRSLSVTGNGLLAAGGNDWRPRVWRSGDTGNTWEELPDPVHGEMFQGGVALRDAIATGEMVVALGTEPTVLILAGARWEDATDEAFPKGGAQPFGTSVAAGSEGTIAAGGHYTPPTGETRESYTGQVWRRSDGGWDAVETEQLAAGHIMDAVPFAGGFAAVGFEDFGVAKGREVAGDQDPDGLIWVSQDGKEWARIGVENARINEANLEYLDDPSPDQAGVIAQLEMEAPPQSAAPAGGAGTRSLSSVAPLAEGFIAVGTVYEGGDADPIVVVSPDGLGFVGEEPLVGGAGIQRYNDVCVGPDGSAVAVGVSGATGTFDAIANLRKPDGTWVPSETTHSFGGPGSQQAYACAAGDDGFVVVGSDDRSGNTDARVWTSDDGVTWTMVESGLFGGPGSQWASAVAAAPDGGWLAAGTDSSGGDSDIALWRISADGDVSRRDEGEPSLSGPGDQTVSNVSVDEDGKVMLVGDDYGRVGLWESDSVDR